jgi:zinc and cadmium transporter
MDTELLLYAAIAALAGSLLSLMGGIYLLYGGKGAKAIQLLAVPFAAGALLAAAFLDLLPEALHEGTAESVLTWVLFGILIFFVLERGLRWFHHHHAHPDEDPKSSNKWLIVAGDTFHNALDGVVIGAAFLVNPATGIVATVAVAAHEIPQELGDFGLLLKKGMRKNMVLLVNIISALATVVAAVGVILLGGAFDLPVAEVLAVTAGFFIYIAVSDIIPTIHAESSSKAANTQTLTLLVGVALVAALTAYTHQFLPDDHDEPVAGQYEQSHSHDDDHHDDHDEDDH